MSTQVAALHGEITLVDKLTPRLMKARDSLTGFEAALRRAGGAVGGFGGDISAVGSQFNAVIGPARAATAAVDAFRHAVASVRMPDFNVPTPSPIPAYAGGTPWTGSLPTGTVAGVVHGQEAVVPADGMRVVPSPRGLMLEGGGGVRFNGATINVYGVNDIESFYDALQREADRRA